MTCVRDLITWLESFAPPELSESWDNVGLLLGDRNSPVARVMTCLTVTHETAREAIDARADLIVSHHPIFFRAVQRIVADPRDANGFAWALARGGVAVYSPHTAFDNCEGGINDMLAARLGLQDVGPLRPGAPSSTYKVMIYAPETDRDAVMNAAFQAGAGRMGNYSECSFSTPGTGTFRGEEGANPTIGEVGRRESVAEQRVEVMAGASVLSAVLRAVRAAHSYEQPAIEVYPLHGEAGAAGSGRVGRLERPLPLGAFARFATECIPSSSPSFVGDEGRAVERVAIVCGAGDDFVKDASRAADVLVTGEARFHRALEAEALGLAMLVMGHHATERPGVVMLATLLCEAFPGLDIWASRSEHDPVRCGNS